MAIIYVWLHCVEWKAGDEAKEESGSILCGILNSILRVLTLHNKKRRTLQNI